MFILTTEKLDWQEVRDIVEEEMGYYPKKETQLYTQCDSCKTRQV